MGQETQETEELVRALRRSAAYFRANATRATDVAAVRNYQIAMRQCECEAACVAQRIGGEVYFRQHVLGAVSEGFDGQTVRTLDEVVRSLRIRRVIPYEVTSVDREHVATALMQLHAYGEVAVRTRLRVDGDGPGAWRRPDELTGPPDVVEIGYTREVL